MPPREAYKESFSAYVLLGINILALVWGAAKLSASVETLSVAVGKVESSAIIVTNKINEHDTRIKVLETLEAKKNDAARE